jgi:hypothetical protein
MTGTGVCTTGGGVGTCGVGGVTSASSPNGLSTPYTVAPTIIITAIIMANFRFFKSFITINTRPVYFNVISWDTGSSPA